MFLESFLDRISTIADTDTSTESEKIAHTFLIYLGVFMSAGGVVWGAISMLSGLFYQSLIPFGYILITAINFIYLHHSKNFILSQNIQVTISLLLPFLCQISLGGLVATGGVVLWSVLTILGGFTFLKKSATFMWFIAYIALLIASGMIDQHIDDFGFHLPEIPSELSTLFFTLNIIMISSSIFGLFYYFVYSNLDLQKKLHFLANTDPLTRLPNRRSFFTCAEAEFKRAKRYERSFSVLMIDIDFFKSINDTHGHAVGDEVLQLFSKVLMECCREVDLLGRYGGEEFVVLLPETSAKDIRLRAQRLIEKTQKIVIHTSKTNFTFTISIGISQLKYSDDDLSAVLKRADEALYRAKESGRNQLQEG